MVNWRFCSITVNGSGLTERRQFRLPSPEGLAVVAAADVNKMGLVSKIIYDDEKAKADIIAFLKKNRNS